MQMTVTFIPQVEPSLGHGEVENFRGDLVPMFFGQGVKPLLLTAALDNCVSGMPLPLRSNCTNSVAPCMLACLKTDSDQIILHHNSVSEASSNVDLCY